MKAFLCYIPVAILACLFLAQSACMEPQQAHIVDPCDVAEAVSRMPPSALRHVKAVCASARPIPVAYDVDVLVVGGTSGGVAAAAEAAKKGATVFLAAQRPYLGADLCGTYRLWLRPDETPDSPLAKTLFSEPPAARRMRNAVPFTYQADTASAGVHKDTPTPSVLNDGKWSSASSQSVQYDGDVTITADLGRVRHLDNVHVMAYQRRSPGLGDDFEVQSVVVSLSSDKQQWKKLSAIKNNRPGEALNQPWGPIELSTHVGGEARYVRLLVKKAEDVNRLLLGEIIIESEQASAETVQATRTPPTPMHVKRTFDQTLLDAGVEFLYGCYATDVLTDARGNVAGIVIANRSGRQAVKAKVVIDATPRASVARMAGAAVGPYPAGPRRFKYVAVGGQMQKGKGVEGREVFPPISATNLAGHAALEYVLTIQMNDGSFASFARAEQVARDKTWHCEQVDASETLFEVPPDPVMTKRSLRGNWPGAGRVNLDVFRPVEFKQLYVLSGCAGLSRAAAEKLLRPLEYMQAGARVAAAAAVHAKRTTRTGTVKVPGRPISFRTLGDIKEDLSGLR
nr:FAD-dependent oxidoreductase [Planctomycetota bacterium]